MNITQFKKIFPALRLIEKPAKQNTKVCKTLDVWKVSEDRLCFGAYDSTKSLEITVNGVSATHFENRVVNFDKFSKLMNAVKTLPSFDIADTDGLQLTFDKRVVSLGSANLQKLSWPTLALISDPDSGQQWDTPSLIEGLDYVAPSVSTDETRFHLNTILFEEEGKIVSTDGHRLHVYDYGAPPSGGKRYLLPLSAVKLLQTAIKACGGKTAMVYSSKSNTVIRYIVDGNGFSFTITSKLTESQFPPYEAVIPKTWEHRCNANAKQFSDAAALLAKLSDNSNNVVEFQLNGHLRFKGEGVEETISASDIEGEGFDFGTCGANGEYLRQAADLPGKDLCVQFGGGLDPIMIKQGRFLAVVMPTRV